MTTRKTTIDAQTGQVTLWDVYRQQWVTQDVRTVSSRVLATLPQEEREMILAAAAESRSTD